MKTNIKVLCQQCGWEGDLDDLRPGYLPTYLPDQFEEIGPVCPKCGSQHWVELED